MNAPDYNPNSPDAMFSRVLTRLDTQDGEFEKLNATLDRIERNTMSGLGKMDKRVLSLEKEKWYQRGFAAGFSGLVVGLLEWAKSRWGN